MAARSLATARTANPPEQTLSVWQPSSGECGTRLRAARLDGERRATRKHKVVSAGNSSEIGARTQGCRRADEIWGLASATRAGPRIRTSATRAVPPVCVSARGGRTLAREVIWLVRCFPPHRLSRRSPCVQPIRDFATSTASLSGRCCIASFARTWPRSSPRPQSATPAGTSPNSLGASSSVICAAACFATVSPGSAVPPAATSCSLLFPAKTAACARRVLLGGWRTPPPTFGTWSCQRSRCGNGC